MQDATINIRIPRNLKERGDAVLRRAHISISDALREFYEYLAHEQQLPRFLSEHHFSRDAAMVAKRQQLRALSGIISQAGEAAVDLKGLKAERLQRQLPPKLHLRKTAG